MRTARASQTFDATVAEAERCWYETSRWSLWVDGLDRIVELDGDWPAAGATVTWQSGPAGRGRVVERVIAQKPLEGQALEVTDSSIRGRQSVTFVPAAAGVEVTLTLEYELLRRSIFTPVVDLLFIKRAMVASLAQTVSRFGVELAAVREPS